MFATCLYVSLIACGQKWDPERMPPVDRALLVKVMPHTKVEALVSFRSDLGDQNNLVVYEQSSGKRLTQWLTHSPDVAREGTWTFPANEGTEPVFYVIGAYSKDGNPGGSGPFYYSKMKILDASVPLVIVGIADFHNGDNFNAGTIKLKTTLPSAPK